MRILIRLLKESKRQIPRGLKSAREEKFRELFGTAEAVPFQNKANFFSSLSWPAASTMNTDDRSITIYRKLSYVCELCEYRPDYFKGACDSSRIGCEL